MRSFNKIGVLGATGLLGTALAKTFREKKMRIVEFNRNDFRNESHLLSKIEKEAFDLLICTIAIPSNRKCIEEPDKAFLANVSVPLKVIRMANTLNVPIFLFSSHGVFEPKNEVEYFGDLDTPNSSTFYGLMKIELERIASELCKSSSTIIRLPSMYGSRLFPGSLGACERIISNLIQSENIEVRRDLYDSYSCVNDIAVHIRDHLYEISQTQIFHIANEGITSMANFAQTAKALLNSKSKITETIASESDIYCNALKTTEIINVSPPVGWEHALNNYLFNLENKKFK